MNVLEFEEFQKKMDSVNTAVLPIVMNWKKEVDAVMGDSTYNLNLVRYAFSRYFDQMITNVYNNHVLERNEQGD